MEETGQLAEYDITTKDGIAPMKVNALHKIYFQHLRAAHQVIEVYSLVPCQMKLPPSLIALPSPIERRMSHPDTNILEGLPLRQH